MTEPAVSIIDKLLKPSNAMAKRSGVDMREKSAVSVCFGGASQYTSNSDISQAYPPTSCSGPSLYTDSRTYFAILSSNGNLPIF